MTDIFYIIPNGSYLQHKFKDVILKSIYKYKINPNGTRLLIRITSDLQSQNKSIMDMLTQNYTLKPNFSINLEEVYISFIYWEDIHKTFGPEYFFIIPGDDDKDENVFISNHGYWNLQHKSDLDVDLSELNLNLNRDSKIKSHLDGSVLNGQAIFLDKEKNRVSINDEIIDLSLMFC